MATSTLVRKSTSFEVSADIGRRELLRAGVLTGAGLAVGLPIIAGCQAGNAPAAESTATPPAKPTGTLRVANNAEPPSLDPAMTGGSYAAGIVIDNVYEGLVGFKGDSFDLVGVLAESFQSSPDAREWTFTLKSGITFHDGEPLTSAAVKDTFEYYREVGIYLVPDLIADATFEAPDSLVFKVVSKRPLPEIARLSARVQIISPRLLNGGSGAVAKTPTGTGPFRFVSYKTAERVVLEANPDYHGSGPYLERLEFPIIPDADGRVAALRSGSVDLVLEVPPANAAPLRGDPSIVVTEKQIWRSTKLLMFTKTPPLDNLKIRQAIAHAVDREALVKAILGGTGTVDDSWTAPGVYGYAKPTTTYPYDPKRASQLVAESGLAAPVEITLAWMPETGSHFGRLAQAIAPMLEEVGISVTVKSVPAAEANNILRSSLKAPRPWHAAVLEFGFPTGTAAELHLNPFVYTGMQLDDPELLDFTDKVMTTADGPQRLELFADVTERIAELSPIVTLYTTTQIDAHKDTVHGYVTTMKGVMPKYGGVYLSSE